LSHAGCIERHQHRPMQEVAGGVDQQGHSLLG
jgi:hypothetical protein